LSSPGDVSCDIQVLLDPSPRYDAISTGYLMEILETWMLIRTTLRLVLIEFWVSNKYAKAPF